MKDWTELIKFRGEWKISQVLRLTKDFSTFRQWLLFSNLLSDHLTTSCKTTPPRNFLSNMSEHTVDIQWVTSDKSTSYLQYGFHNWIFWPNKEHFSASCIFFLHPTGRNSQGEHDLDPKPPLFCGWRSRSPSFDCSPHDSTACSFSLEMNLIVVLFYF